MAEDRHAHDVSLAKKNSPAILSGLFGCYPENIYQMRQDGRLPPNPESSNYDCIKFHFEYLKGKVNARRTTMGEAKLEQDIRNGKAKEVLQWLEVKEKKESLVEVGTLKKTFESVFYTVNSGLVNLTRTHPETQKEVDKLLASWQLLGTKMLELAKEEGDLFVEAQLNKELDLQLEKDEEEPIKEEKDV